MPVNGNRLSTNYPDGVSQNMTYNGAGELSGVNAVNNNTSTTLFNYTYSWAQGANDQDLRRSVNETVASTTYTYSYDSQNRLARAQQTAGGSNDYQYTYDNNGNILTEDLNGTTTTSSYNAGDQTCWAYSGTTSDSCGSTPSGATTYSYDSAGELTGTSAGFSSSYNSKQQANSITPTGGTATSMAYSGTGQSARTSAGSTTFVNATGELLTSSQSSTTTSYTDEPDGTLTSLSSSGSTYYYLYDGEGNVVGLVDSSGTRQATYTYDPYGNTTASGTDASINPFRYQAGYEDTASGLYHFGDRYYNPATANWTQLDPTDLDPGYIYASDDPVNLSDPTGDTHNANGVACGFSWSHLSPYCDFRMSSSLAGSLVVLLGAGESVIDLCNIFAPFIVGPGDLVAIFCLAIRFALVGSAAYIGYLIGRYHSGIYLRYYFFTPYLSYVKQQ